MVMLHNDKNIKYNKKNEIRKGVDKAIKNCELNKQFLQ